MELGYPSGGQYTKNAIITNLTGGRWISLFAQDNFRLSPRLNVQSGLRWEYRRQPMDKNKLATFYPLSNSMRQEMPCCLRLCRTRRMTPCVRIPTSVLLRANV